MERWENLHRANEPLKEDGDEREREREGAGLGFWVLCKFFVRVFVLC